MDNLLLNRLYLHSDIKEHVFGVEIKKDIPYLEAGTSVRTFDVFSPDNAKDPLPMIVNIHCEGFVRENIGYDDNFCAYLASKGFCVFSVKLTAASFNSYRSLVEDVTDAFIKIGQTASLYNADTENAFLCADSVGANLALVSLCINQSLLLKSIYKFENYSLSFKAIGLSSPVTELSFIKNNPLYSGIKKALFGDSIKENPYSVCSSLKEVYENAAKLPPVYMVSSVDDPMNSQSLSFSSFLRKRNIRFKFRYCEKGEYHKLSHAFNVLFPEYPESVNINTEMTEFFKSFI